MAKEIKKPVSFYASLGNEGDTIILTKKEEKEGLNSKTKTGKRKKIVLSTPIQTGKSIIQIRALNNERKRTEPLRNGVTSKVLGIRIDESDLNGKTFQIETLNSFYKAKFC